MINHEEISQQGRKMRTIAMERAKKRKEEFLGARVPKELRDSVIRRAEEQGIPVSILIRKLLEREMSRGDSGGEVRDNSAVSQDVESLSPERRATAGEGYSNVLGWNEITLNQAVECSSCHRYVGSGKNAYVGITMAAGKHVILCAACK